MKKFICIAVATITLMGISGCGNSPTDATDSDSDLLTNGRKKEMLAEKGWKGYCADDMLSSKRR